MAAQIPTFFGHLFFHIGNDIYNYDSIRSIKFDPTFEADDGGVLSTHMLIYLGVDGGSPVKYKMTEAEFIQFRDMIVRVRRN